jgi:hypothetical protein
VAAEGATLLARSCRVLVVVDVLRFTTAVEIAVSQGAQVVPRPWPGQGAAVPGPGGPGPSSLSPVSLLGIPAGTRLELASPNEATVALAAAGAGGGAGRVPAERLGGGCPRRHRRVRRRPALHGGRQARRQPGPSRASSTVPSLS